MGLRRDRVAVMSFDEMQKDAARSAFGGGLDLSFRPPDLPDEIATWSLTSLQTRLIKIGARVVLHARAVTFQLAEVMISSYLFHRILAAIHRLRPSPVPI